MDNRFEEAAMMLIDDHIDWLKNSSRAKEMRNMMCDTQYDWECRTLHINGRRQVGHSSLARSLAFDIGSDIGCKYSTIIISPTVERARYNYEPHNMYYDPDGSLSYIEELKRCIADDYAREIGNIMRDRTNFGGKVLAASIICQTGFGARQFCERQKNAIFEMTGKKVDKIDLCIIDGFSSLRPQQVDTIHQMFSYDVDLFVHLQ